MRESGGGGTFVLTSVDQVHRTACSFTGQLKHLKLGEGVGRGRHLDSLEVSCRALIQASKRVVPSVVVVVGGGGGLLGPTKSVHTYLWVLTAVAGQASTSALSLHVLQTQKWIAARRSSR